MPDRRTWPSLLRNAALLLLTRAPQERRAALRRVASAGGAGRFARSLRGDQVVVAGLARGMRFPAGAVPLDHVHAHSILRGSLEVPVQEALRRTIAPGAVFFDVGANIGFFSLLGARLVGAEGRVVAFEPVPESAASIRASGSLNGFEHLEVRDVAVADRSGQGELCVVEDASWSRLTTYREHELMTRQAIVTVVTIDELVEAGEVPIPDVIKIDVEGAELEVLAGMGRLIESRQPTIICELHVTNVEFARLMHSHGYAVENLDGPELIAEAGPNVHALARPSSGDQTRPAST